MHLSSIPSIIHSFRNMPNNRDIQRIRIIYALLRNHKHHQRVNWPTLVFGNHNNGHKLVSVYTWFARSIGRPMPRQCVYLHNWPLIVPCIIQRHHTVIAWTAMVTKTNKITNALWREVFFKKTLEVVLLVIIDHVKTLIQVLDWHRTGDKSLSKPPPRKITGMFVTIKDTVFRILKQSES